MKKFIKYFALFTVLLIVINSYFFYIVDSLYLSDYTKLDISGNKYLLADSHGLPLENYTDNFGLINISEGSESYYDMRRKLNYLIEKTNIDTVLLTVSNHTLSFYREDMNNLDRSVFYCNKSDFNSWFEYIKSRYIRIYVPLFNSKHRDVVKSYLSSKIFKSSKIKGFAEFTDEEKIANSKKRVKQQFPQTKGSANLKEELDLIIETCKNNNIELIGVKFPLSKAYIHEINGFSYGADSLFFKHGLTVLDFQNVYSHNDSLFQNQDHLNVVGGIEFSNLLFQNLSK